MRRSLSTLTITVSVVLLVSLPARADPARCHRRRSSRAHVADRTKRLVPPSRRSRGWWPRREPSRSRPNWPRSCAPRPGTRCRCRPGTAPARPDGAIVLVACRRRGARRRGLPPRRDRSAASSSGPRAPAGLSTASRRLRQLLSPWVESATVRPVPWTDARRSAITDRPRYAYRGVMLDIARHFQPPAAVKRLIDNASAYKINVLHLHVSDDQGFRIAIKGRPELTEIGGAVLGQQRPRRLLDAGGVRRRRRLRGRAPHDGRPRGRHARAHQRDHHVLQRRAHAAGPGLPDINCGANTAASGTSTFAVGYSALCPESATHLGDPDRHHHPAQRDVAGPVLPPRRRRGAGVDPVARPVQRLRRPGEPDRRRAARS